MKLSKAWNTKVQRLPSSVAITYSYLFEQHNEIGDCPIDGIELLTDSSLAAGFYEIKSLFTKQYIKANEKQPYKVSYSLGCITVMLESIFPCVPPVKIKINPSKGGLSPKQLYEWCRFLVTDVQRIFVKKVDTKLDFFGLDPYECMNKIWWCSDFRKIDEEYFEKGTLYLGSTHSKIRIRIYDKGKEQGKSIVWTRIETTRSYDKKEQMTLGTFLNRVTELKLFEEVILVNAAAKDINDILRQYNVQAINNGKYSMIATLKQLDVRKRNRVIRALDKIGFVNSLLLQYQDAILKWRKQDNESFL
ncbi:hypothetical protein [Mesobacillus thioparans]|uniref:hypothetical protein n=1 Tax=Mesobacillus thioparans TaxID=370439 RepID=UPI0039EE7BE5